MIQTTPLHKALSMNHMTGGNGNYQGQICGGTHLITSAVLLQHGNSILSAEISLERADWQTIGG